jgi:TetR/AcrR family transcriptional repressor of nem operon
MQSETANLILQTAQKLIVERGYFAFSYADIAQTVAIRKPSIHHHFPTKAALVVEVLKRYREQPAHTTAALDHKFYSPLDRLRSVVQHWETCIKDQSESFCVATLLAAELPVLPQEVGAEVRHYFDDLGEWLESTFAEGRRTGCLFYHDAPQVEAQSFIVLFHGAMLSARAYGDCGVYQDVTQSALNRLSTRK